MEVSDRLQHIADDCLKSKLAALVVLSIGTVSVE
jgi:hypothetical protein